jgi:excisionase family DNA binding protein
MEKFYTVEEIASMTSMTTRTIRNYIKNGILKGRKIGGQWRFTEEDIKNLMDNGTYREEYSNTLKQDVLDFIDGVNTFADNIGEIQTCSIIDLYQEQEVVLRKQNKLMEFINSQNPSDTLGNYMSFSSSYIESESKTRIVIFANPKYLIEALTILQ